MAVLTFTFLNDMQQAVSRYLLYTRAEEQLDKRVRGSTVVSKKRAVRYSLEDGLLSTRMHEKFKYRCIYLISPQLPTLLHLSLNPHCQLTLLLPAISHHHPR